MRNKKLNLLAITGATPSFRSSYSGYVGIGPTTLHPSVDAGLKRYEEEHNFMAQLKAKGYIEHEVVSIFQTANHDHSSSIKFGSWDEEALEDKSPEAVRNKSALKILRTIPSPSDTSAEPSASWALALDSVRIGEDTDAGHSGQKTYFDGENKSVILEPALPYIYVPEVDWRRIVDMFKAADAQEIGDGGEENHAITPLECDYTTFACKWANSCEEIASQKEGVDGHHFKANSFHFELGEGQNGDKKEIVTLKASDLGIPGRRVGETEKNTCYLPFFKADTLNGQWILGGTVFMHNYVVFDMTPMTVRKENYMHIGIGRSSGDKLQWEKYGGNLYESHHIENMAGEYPWSSLIALYSLLGSFGVCGIYYLCNKYVEGEPNMEEENDLYGTKVDSAALNTDIKEETGTSPAQRLD